MLRGSRRAWDILTLKGTLIATTMFSTSPFRTKAVRSMRVEIGSSSSYAEDSISWKFAYLR